MDLGPKFAEALMQKLKEKKEQLLALRCWKTKINYLCIFFDLSSFLRSYTPEQSLSKIRNCSAFDDREMGDILRMGISSRNILIYNFFHMCNTKSAIDCNILHFFFN